MAPLENGNGQAEIKAIAELAVHVKYMREQIDNLTEKMATQDDIKQLRREIEENSPSAVFTQITKVAAGIVTFAAALGVVVAILKWAKAI